MSIGSALDSLLGRFGLAGRLRRAQAVFLWPAVAGEELTRHTAALEVRDGVLRVAVRSSTWAAQLGFLRTDLLSALNARLDPPGLRGIRFHVGLPAGSGGDPGTLRSAVMPLAPADEEAVEASGALVADADVRRAWKRALTAALRRRRRLEVS